MIYLDYMAAVPQISLVISPSGENAALHLNVNFRMKSYTHIYDFENAEENLYQ